MLNVVELDLACSDLLDVILDDVVNGGLTGDIDAIDGVLAVQSAVHAVSLVLVQNLDFLADVLQVQIIGEGDGHADPLSRF